MLSVQRLRAGVARSSSSSSLASSSSRFARLVHTSAARHTLAPTLIPAVGNVDVDVPPPVQSIWSRVFGASSKMPKVTLDLEFPGVPDVTNTEAKPLTYTTQTSTTSNGLRVVSLSDNSPVVAVGVFIDSGSRDESSSSYGITQLLELLAFNSTKNQSEAFVAKNFQRLGSNFSASASRESIFYSADALLENVPGVVQNLADIITNPLYIFDEVDLARKKSEHYASERAHIPQAHIQDLLHQAAYKGNGLGRPLYGSSSEISKVTGSTLKSHHENVFVPRRMAFVGVGIPHDQLHQLAEENFKTLKDNSGLARQASKYVGGDVRSHDANSNDVHLAIAFESVPWNSKDVVPVSVLQAVLGGGSSFSSGGPGKGISSRIYQSILAKNDWVNEANSFNLFYSDSALFALYASSSASKAEQLTNVIVSELKKLTSSVDSTELSRAKNQLRSSVLSTYESRLHRLEDVGKQVLASGTVKTPEEIIAQIEKVTAEDVTRVAKKLLSSAPTVAAFGNVTNLPRYDQIEKSFK